MDDKNSKLLAEVSYELGEIARLLLLAIDKSAGHTQFIEMALERVADCQQNQLHKIRKAFEALSGKKQDKT